MEKRDADGIINALKVADLRGMGGAGFRTHRNGRPSAAPAAT